MGARGRLLHEDEMARIFDVLIYQEHVTEEDLDIALDEMGVKCARSPLHDQDRYDKTSVRKWEKRHPFPTPEELINKPKIGELKKPHWHVTVQLKGRKKLQNILKLFPEELGVTSVWKNNDPDHAIRYLCHLDSPKKAQYKITDVVGFGGINLAPLERPTDDDKANAIAVICNHVKEDCCTNFYDLSNWVMEQKDAEMFKSLVGNTGFYKNYMDGLRQKLIDVNTITGLNKLAKGHLK